MDARNSRQISWPAAAATSAGVVASAMPHERDRFASSSAMIPGRPVASGDVNSISWARSGVMLSARIACSTRKQSAWPFDAAP